MSISYGKSPHDMNFIIKDIYLKLRRWTEFSQVDREEFASNNLIFDVRYSRWVSSHSCIWKGRPALAGMYALSHDYGACEAFFRDVIRLQNATIDDAIQELLTLRVQASPRVRYKELLLMISEFLREGSLASTAKKLSKQYVVPTRLGDKIFNATFEQVWYIPDRTSLTNCFEKTVHLMDFTVGEVGKLLPLISAMGLTTRLLSKAVHGYAEPHGFATPDEEKTRDLVEKAKHIIR